MLDRDNDDFHRKGFRPKLLIRKIMAMLVAPAFVIKAVVAVALVAMCRDGASSIR